MSIKDYIKDEERATELLSYIYNSNDRDIIEQATDEDINTVIESISTLENIVDGMGTEKEKIRSLLTLILYTILVLRIDHKVDFKINMPDEE